MFLIRLNQLILTRAVIFHINAKEDRLYEDDNYDGNIIPYLTHEELLIYTMYQLECSLEGEEVQSIRFYNRTLL